MNGVNNITVGWTIGGAILVLLVGLSIFYTGRDTHPNENAPNAVTQPQQK